jgi:hypothetical protein
MPASISAREPTLGRQNIDAFIFCFLPVRIQLLIHHRTIAILSEPKVIITKSIMPLVTASRKEVDARGQR